MTEMTAIERMTAVLEGQQPDRVPVGFWHHFHPDKVCGPAAVDAHLEHLHRFDLDFLKIMNDNEYPTKRDIRSAADLRGLPVLCGDEEGMGRQLELIRALAAEVGGKVLLSTTLFNSWTLLRKLVARSTNRYHLPPVLRGPVKPVDLKITELLAEDRTAVADALDVIASSQANFAKRCIEAGADGVFLSVRDDYIDTESNGLATYDELVQPCDKRILAAANDARLNMLHVCGVPRNFDRFTEYPVHVINWADRAAGPAIRTVIGKIKPVCCGGVDNLSTLPSGTPGDVELEVRDALDQAGGSPMIVSPGCTYDPDAVPRANLEAMVRAARQGVSPG